MANYCANTVEFTGQLPGLLRLRAMFAAAEYGKAFRPDVLPEEPDSSYFLGASLEGNKLFYETRWVPNLEGVLRLAEHLGLDYVHWYEEPANMVYGEAWYKDGEFEHVWLDTPEVAGHDYGSWEGLLEDKKRVLAETPAMFRDTSSVTAADLEETYGPLLTGDLFMKLAEHQNFTAAKTLSDSWDEETVWAMETYLDGEMELVNPKTDRGEVVALLFLRDCLNKWQPGPQHQTGRNR
ncbi:hypothetical protein DIU31_031835 [Mucilaginibacter rubeus]|uniref:YubB ferredoxin-like domain-containing protein n=1 Tax=Mucilaginibacter rubeus TaxID=2027860 RepID=A0AAE6JL21_9SPHI|nr:MULTISPECIES: hypothetical protein [Mucilaginibacter]QEM07872.1 hypothetical protein DIU31_031835 [Mucilaginibacter rubeus]QEM20324.1 hypothetical protein DIU38_031440 [Mucilaginibacter gossypii]QTE42957.1 hypothetical protein J3L19_29220 [Mucilaginibacter rubeus]QTE49558.1 hypothetical protein J3L21_29180 [Mucilaginibacter rubeus]QTE54654.1 hypothetical protein J3L23_20805 [Mucilaginibacter rubeus]